MPELQATFLTVDPDGTVRAFFPGGVDMLANTFMTPVEDRRIAFKRESDGRYVAFVATGPTNNLEMVAGSPDTAQVSLEADLRDPDVFSPTIASALLRLQSDVGIGGAPVTEARIHLQDPPIGLTPSVDRFLLRGDGSSNFVQCNEVISGATRQVMVFGPFQVFIPAVGAGALAAVTDSPGGLDTTGSAMQTVVGSCRVAAANGRITFQGFNFPSSTSVQLVFYNPTGAASVANIPFTYEVHTST